MKFLKNQKKMLFIFLALFSLTTLISTIVILRYETLIFPKATNYNLTGTWNVTINISQPETITQNQVANLTQNSTGRVTGTITDQNGQNSTNITGQVTGNNFVSDPIHATGTQLIFTYEAILNLNGTINDTNNQVNGTVTGQITSPIQDNLSGTFTATRIGTAPTPTATIQSTPTSTPIPTTTTTATSYPSPTPTTTSSANPTTTPFPTPTATSRIVYPSNISYPTPITGNSFSTILGIVGAVGTIFISFLLLL